MADFDDIKSIINDETLTTNDNNIKEVKLKISDIILSLIVSFFYIFIPCLILFCIITIFLQIEDITLISIIGIIIFFICYSYTLFGFKSKDYQEMNIAMQKQYTAEIGKLSTKLVDNQSICSKQKQYITKIEKLLTNKINDVMLHSSELSADIKTINYDASEQYLKKKKRPAIAEAERISDLKKQTKEYIRQYKLMKYEYDYLFSLFPELENYIEQAGDNKEDIEEIKEKYDYVRKWVTKEEYKNLSENDRNQLALERYINSRKKNKWQIGRDYEMYIGYEYEKQGYKVQYIGAIKKLEDMGRDLIVSKNKTVYIVQCKYWSKNKIIHENHICQLFGTTIQYNIENNCKAKPVFITSTQLSETALKFAKYLDIEVVQNKEFQEFPRIKCNIGKNNEICRCA